MSRERKRRRAAFFSGWCLAPFLISAAVAADPLFVDGFEQHAVGQLPGAPWKEETYQSGAVIAVDDTRAFGGSRSMRVLTPAGARYRRGYVAIHLGGPLPQLQSGMFGRAMVWLEAAPQPVPGGAVHWTLLQGEGRSADDRYNSIYRLGLEARGGLGLMANFETTPPVTTDCKQRSDVTLPVRRWACVEWHFEVAGNELEFWIDGERITRVRDRAADAQACKGEDLGGTWAAPPKFDSLYLGFERYTDSANDQRLWIDDVALSKARVGCPAPTSK